MALKDLAGTTCGTGAAGTGGTGTCVGDTGRSRSDGSPITAETIVFLSCLFHLDLLPFLSDSWTVVGGGSGGNDEDLRPIFKEDRSTPQNNYGTMGFNHVNGETMENFLAQRVD